MEEKDIQVREKKEIESQGEMTQAGAFFVPNVDVFEDKAQMVLVADMPGVGKDSVDIRVEENRLLIKGSVSRDIPGEYVLSEYSIGDYMRTFTLSNFIDQSSITASIKNGVLRIIMPKSESLKPRKISVTTV
jgi:HSP20 family molecular chaperone IbpA